MPEEEIQQRRLDVRDALLGVGLALLAWGLWHVNPPLAAVVPGMILVCVAIFGVR